MTYETILNNVNRAIARYELEARELRNIAKHLWVDVQNVLEAAESVQVVRYETRFDSNSAALCEIDDLFLGTGPSLDFALRISTEVVNFDLPVYITATKEKFRLELGPQNQAPGYSDDAGTRNPVAVAAAGKAFMQAASTWRRSNAGKATVVINA